MKYNVAIALAALPDGAIAEHRFDSVRKWRFDFAWPDKLVALEVQGGLFSGGAHARGPAIKRDHEKRNAAAAQGWRILYCTPEEIYSTKLNLLIKRCISKKQ